MMSAFTSAKCLWWLVHKDLTREVRASHGWSKTLLLGVVLVLLLATQIDLPVEQQTQVIAGMMWVAIFFSGTLAVDRAFAGEHDDGCWQALVLYPIAPSVLFLAKMVVNVVLLALLELILIPLFVVLTDVPLLARPGLMALVATLANIGFAAVGTLIGALTAGLRNRSGLLSLVLLPLAAPVLMASAAATRIAISGDNDPLWMWWVQLLAVFAVMFTVLGAMVFGYVLEE
jgi:heme exporter protein CcmB